MPALCQTSGAPTRRPDALRPRLLFATAVLMGVFATMLAPRILTVLGIPDFGLWFLDSHAILAANDAVTAQLNPFDSIPFDVMKRRHVYSEWWLHLRDVGLTRHHNFIFGGACVIGFLAVALASLRPRSFGAAAYFAAITLSAPVLLAVNRANNDLVIFTVLGAPLLLLGERNALWKLTLVCAALLVGTGLKYYPVVAILAVAIMEPASKRAWWLTGVSGLAAGAILWSERASIARGRFPIPESLHVFGSPELWRDLHLGTATTFALSAGLLLAAAGWLVRRGVTSGLNQVDAGSTRERWMFAVGALLLTGCFLAGTSFAYRMIFALWLCPWLWHQIKQGPNAGVARLAAWLLLLIVWLDGIFCAVMNLWVRVHAPRAELVWRYLTQPLHWILMALLAGWLLDAALRARPGWMQRRDRAGTRPQVDRTTGDALAAPDGISSPAP